MGRGNVYALLAISGVEFLVVSWCSLWPLRGQLNQLGQITGWLNLYSFALGNLDVLLLSALRTLTFGVLILASPARKGTGYGAPTASNHKQVRLAITALSTVYETFLLVKAAGVAVTAPAQLWPQRPGLLPPPGTITNIGLVYMFTSIGLSVVASLLSAWQAKAVVRGREAAWDEDTDPLRAPLLTAHAAKQEGDRKGKMEEKERKKKVAQKTVLELLRLSFPDLPLLAVAFTAGAVAALGQALIPFFTGRIIDYASIDPDRSKFRSTTEHLLLIAAATGFFVGARGGLFTVAMCKLNVRIRTALFHALMQMEIGFFDTTKTGEITSRLAADTTTVADQVCLNLNVMMRSATQATMVLFFMFAASWRLTVVTFILVPVVLVISKTYGKYFSLLSKKVQTELAEANSVAEEVLSSMTTVKAHAAQDSAEAAYAAKLGNFYSLQLKESALYSLYAAINTFLPNLVSAVVLYYGGNLVLSGMMSPGSLVSFMLYQQSLSSAFQMMGDVFSALTAAVGAADKVIELMKRQPEISNGGSLILPEFQGRIELENVVFHYPARSHITVLQGMSLLVNPGEVVALVGSSGGGKSSIVKLLERYYLPQGGRVLLDGYDLGDFDPKWLRRQVALVSQEPVLYARSIKRNIIYGLEPEDGVTTQPSQEEIEEAAKQANAHDFISSFPDGYETNCGEKGVQMSGGQKQRIAIARALVRRPRVLLLDEATSALDADSEAVVQDALDRVMEGRTTLVIAHRLSTIQNAHRIFVIGKGVVQEVGTHDELLAAGGMYASLVRRQLQKAGSNINLAGIANVQSSASLLSLEASAVSPAPPAGKTGGTEAHSSQS